MAHTRPQVEKRKLPPGFSGFPTKNPKKNVTDVTDSLKAEINYKMFLKDYDYDISKIKYAKLQKEKNKIINTETESSSNLPGTSSSTQQNQLNDTQENNEWLKPKRTARPNKKPKIPAKIIDENAYSSLSESEDAMETKSRPSKITKKFSSTKSKQINNEPNTTSKNRPPPIHILNQKIKVITDLMITNNIDKDSFFAKQRFSTNVRITPINQDVYNKTKQVLQAAKIQFYTFTPREQRPKTLIFKGMTGEYNDADTLIELKEKAGKEVNIIKFNKFVFNKSRPDLYHHMVQISNDSNSSELTKITGLSCQRITWEHMRKKKLFQCKRCQRIGHASVNCNLPYRCVKCAEEHEPGKCLIQKEDEKDKLKCANCGETGHPANYYGCKFIKFTLSQIKKQTTTKVPRTFDANKSIRTNVSYAQMMQPNQNNINTHSNNTTQIPHQYYQHNTPINLTENIKNEIINEIMSKMAILISNSLASLTEKINKNQDDIYNIIGCLGTINE